MQSTPHNTGRTDLTSKFPFCLIQLKKKTLSKCFSFASDRLLNAFLSVRSHKGVTRHVSSLVSGGGCLVFLYFKTS